MIIYQIQNIINNRLYIGKHKNCNSDEELQKSSYWGSGRLIKKAITKYGKDTFIRKVLLKNIFDASELNQYEIFFIKENKSHISEGGYNLTWGGDGLVNPTKETRKLMSEVHKGQHSSPNTEFKKGLTPWLKGKTHSEEVKNIIKLKRKDQPPPMKGKHHSAESNEKNRLSHLGKSSSSKTKFRKGQIPWNKGIKCSEETKRKISETKKELQVVL